MWSVYQTDPAGLAEDHLKLTLDKPMRECLKQAASGRRVGISSRTFAREDVRRLEIAITLWKLLCFPESEVFVGVGFRDAWSSFLQDAKTLIHEGSRDLRKAAAIPSDFSVVNCLGNYARGFLVAQPQFPALTPGFDTALMIVNMNHCGGRVMSRLLRHFNDASLVSASTYT